ncbi:MAG: 50S ribosomal protein L25 [Desulfobulbaceae bacterium]|jgi:large subunit ribosomal protein L25|nr:50S ribosomal protein L25 [Desulfobulbaceae bacterium]HKJ15448.1 50S ribosomal protein L25 [Desulfobulbales bacterium]MDH3541427.1 50S ribosomal protein L25 [Desulfobulbaceae bacterium]MDH3781214.1 50S ribosomal protein L25 [Desulfobulbaceae bacterium]MDH3865623.1 50S ribosomal protein L25 [Desulfobulbaceae bacterium]
MIQQDMTAAVRQDFGKGATHRLRQSGYAPAILYGKKSEPIALAMETKTLTRDLLRLHGHNVVVSLDIEGENGKKKHHVLIKDIQTDPITDSVLHVDFLEIDMDKEIVLDVAVVYEGTAKGVDLGGILNIMAHTVKIKGMPLAIPDEIMVDVTPLELTSHGITCGDLTIPENVTLEEELDKVCVSIVAPMAEEEEVEEEEAVEAEEGAEGPAETEEPATPAEE